jgi:hypothetical protein
MEKNSQLSVSHLYEYLLYLYLVIKGLSSLLREHFCMQQEDCICHISVPNELNSAITLISVRYYSGLFPEL